MPYVKRDDDGNIISIAQIVDKNHIEYMSATNVELVAFISGMNESTLSKSALEESDKDIARVTEDLIHLLIEKNIILFTELPEAVQSKLLSREKLRSSLNNVIDNILDDNESI